MQKEAAEKSRGHKKTLLHSQHHHVKAVRRPWWRRMGTKTKLRPHDGLQ